MQLSQYYNRGWFPNRDQGGICGVKIKIKIKNKGKNEYLSLGKYQQNKVLYKNSNDRVLNEYQIIEYEHFLNIGYTII